jgi:hypothetical protein
MTINHFFIIVLPSSGLIAFTGDALGFVSMSEVFFFLGGFSTFVAYSGLKTQDANPASRLDMLWSRIRTLCLAEAWMLLGYCVMTGAPPLNFAALSPAGTSTRGLMAVGLDILPVHIMILSVVAVFFEKLRNMEVRKLLFISVSVWACAWSIGSEVRANPSIHPPDLLFFNPFAAQILYALGYTAAFWIYSQQLLDIRQRLRSSWVTAGVIFVPTLFFCVKHFNFGDIPSLPVLTSRRDFGPLRILNFIALGVLVLRLSYSISLERVLRPFSLMGRRCLALFASTTVGMFALQPLTLGRASEPHTPPLLTLIFVTLTVALLAHFVATFPRSIRSSRRAE